MTSAGDSSSLVDAELAALDGGGGRERLERRARRIEALDRPVQQRKSGSLPIRSISFVLRLTKISGLNVGYDASASTSPVRGSIAIPAAPSRR